MTQVKPIVVAAADVPDAGVVVVGVDAPKVFDDSDIRIVKAGDLVPYDGLLYSARAAVVTESGQRKCEADRDNAQSELGSRPTNNQIYIAAALLIIGAFAGGVAVGTSLNHK